MVLLEDTGESLTAVAVRVALRSALAQVQMNTLGAEKMRIECEDLEADIKENGWTEMFTQSANVEPYARARPEGQSYQSLNGNYQKIIRQLDSMLPAVAGNSEDDGFGSFVTGRDDP